MSLFDAYLFADWSAASSPHPKKPKADAVWIGRLVQGFGEVQETYHRTRHEALARISSDLLEHVRKRRRVLLGFDFPYGYPAGLARALDLPPGPRAWWAIWSELADRVRDNAGNRNNRFIAAGELNARACRDGSGPFWACPPGKRFANLQPRSPGFPFQARGKTLLHRLRLAEERLPGTQETWKLFGAGSVGGQALLGIPHVLRLRRRGDLARLSRIWPFETGFAKAPCPGRGPFILHAEIWPGLVQDRARSLIRDDPGLIRDQAQVRALCAWAADCDQTGELGRHFDRPGGMTRQQVQTCVEEEGWILGTS